MASSQTAICNMALSHLGVTTFISSLTERSKEATVCALWFDSVRDSVLESFDWTFARRRVALAETSTEVTNWEYAYAFPSDCVKARRILIAGQRTPRPDERIPFELASTGDARLILTDLEDAELIYTVRVTDPNLFSASFVDAMAAALSARIAMPLTVSTTITQSAAKLAADALDQAVASDAGHGQEDPEPAVSFIAGRD